MKHSFRVDSNRCVVCAGLSKSLPSECPGVPMSVHYQNAVFTGVIDFVNGHWIVKPLLSAENRGVRS